MLLLGLSPGLVLKVNLPACPGSAALSPPLARPLSDSGGEADGSGFLCTNQGGICSLTDTSPLTQVSSHIHYSSSARWATVKASERGGRWVGGGAEGRLSSLWAASFIPTFNCLCASTWRRQTSCNISSNQLRRVSWRYCLSSHTSCVLHSCPVWWQRGTSHLDGIRSRAAEFRGGRRANLAPLRSDGSYLEFWNIPPPQFLISVCKLL